MAENVLVLDPDELAAVRRRLADVGPWDDAVRLIRTLDAETSDHNATKVKCEVYGHTCQHIGEVIGWDRSQMRDGESLWDAMARCVVRYANRRGHARLHRRIDALESAARKVVAAWSYDWCKTGQALPGKALVDAMSDLQAQVGPEGERRG